MALSFRKTYSNRKLIFWAFLRFVMIVVLALAASYPVHKQTYSAYFNRTVIKLHTLNISQLAVDLTTKFSYFLEVQDLISLQQELNAQFGLFGFVITDCTREVKACPEQKIVFTSSQSLPWKKYPAEASLPEHPYSILMGAVPLVPDRYMRGRFVQEVDENGNTIGREILGRLYLISNIPHDFEEDFIGWLKKPLRDIGPHRIYLKTVAVFLFGAWLISLSLELFLGKRRLQQQVARQRHEELRATADSYLKQMEDKNQLLIEQQDYSMEQFAAYAARIRELESRQQNDTELQSFTEEIIAELEEVTRQQRQRNEEELSKTRQEMDQLQAKLYEFEHAVNKQKAELGKELETAFRPLFTNPFEQRVYEMLANSQPALNNEWLIIPNFNVGIRKNFSQFTDCLVVSKDGVVVIEAKNYPGLIVADGDAENSKWYYHNPKRREMKCPWGLNPYHQINHYCMSVLTLLNSRGRWKMPVIGVIVFPNQADLSSIGSQMGSFYCLVTIGKMVEAIERLFQEARRTLPPGRRPTLEQVDNVLRGRKEK
jgi:hypothetical protein